MQSLSQRRLWSFRAVLIGLVVCVLAPLLFVVSAYAVWNLRLHREAVDQGLVDTARVLSLAVDRDIDTIEAALLVLASSPPLKSGDFRAFEPRARDISAHYDGWIVVTDPSMQQIMNTLRPYGDPLPKTSAPDAVARVFATQTPETCNLVFGKVAGRFILCVLVPIINDGRVTHVMDMAFLPKRLSTLLAASQELPSPWNAVVVDGNNVIIASTNGEGKDIGRAAPKWFGKETSGVVEGVLNRRVIDNRVTQVAFRRSTASGWTTVVTAPEDVISARTQQAAWILAAGVVISLLLACAAALLIGQRIAAPIQALAKGASDLVSGEKIKFPSIPVSEVAEVSLALIAAAAAHQAESEMRHRLEQETRSRESAEMANSRYRALTNVIASIVYTTPPNGQVVDMSGWRLLTGQTVQQVRGWGWLDALHPDDRNQTYDAILAAIEARQPYDIEYRVRDLLGRYRWFNARGAPLINADGSVREWVGVCIDIEERKAAAERQDLLMAELDHRVRNILATIQSMVTLTSNSASTKEEYAALLCGRIAAMARTHGLLSLHTWDGATLSDIVRSEIAPLAGSGNQVQIAGDRSYVLKPKDAADFALVIHELTTNAAKYGALSVRTGKVEISWNVDGDPDPMLCFKWRESGGPPVVTPRQRGFGSRLIEAVFADNIGRSVEFDFARTGFCCRLTMPVNSPPPSEMVVDITPDSLDRPVVAFDPSAARRLLVVEDEPLIAMEIQKLLTDEGYEVLGPSASVSDALKLADDEGLSGAILDVNLGNEMVYPVAEKLLARRLAIVFLTGYEGDWLLPEHFRPAPALAKPLNHAILIRTLNAVLNPMTSSIVGLDEGGSTAGARTAAQLQEQDDSG